MGTSYNDIISLALHSIQDYKLDILYQRSFDDWMQHLALFMIRGLDRFDNCKVDLSKRDDTLMEFESELSMIEQGIIADYTALMWLDKEMLDVRQITGMLQNGREANRFSEANLMNAKSVMRRNIISDIDTKQVHYSLKNMNSSWFD